MKFMGFSVEDYNRCIEIGISDTKIYKQTGNSIVTTCLYLLFEHLYKAQYDTSYTCIDEGKEVEDKEPSDKDLSYLLNAI